MKKQKGITLIALIITIIVLIILSGLSIAILTGENGIFKQSETAKEEYTKGKIKEKLELEITELMIEATSEGKKVTKEEIIDRISLIGAITNDSTENIIQGEYNNYEFIIDLDDNNSVTIGGLLTRVKPTVTVTLLTTEEGLEKVEVQVIASTEDGDIASIEAMNGATLKTENSASDKIFEIASNGTYNFKITGTNGRIEIGQIEVSNILEVIKAESILSAIGKINKNGIFRVQVEDEIYGLHMYVYYSDVNFNGENIVDGATLTDGTYVFGNENDISKSKEEEAENTIVIKVNGNINIENGTTIEPISGDFGGPKGIILYTDYKLSINNGTIKNTTGCNANSQNIYLYKNNDSSYEMISKELVTGGIGETISKGTGRGSIFLKTPQVGNAGTGRQTGGGGAGYAAIGNNSNNAGSLKATGGSGAAGTSWSGGAGGGGAAIAGNGNSKTIVAENAYNCIAGNGICHGYGYDYTVYVTGYGGSGNGSGKGYYITTKGTEKDGELNASYNGENGVGGVIIIYCDTLETANANLIANGASSKITYGKAYTSTASANGNIYAGGGGSGGGSVNVFYKNISNSNLDENLTIDVSGQGTGGNGTYNIGNISTGKYETLKTSN